MTRLTTFVQACRLLRIRRGEAAQGSGDEENNFDGPRLAACRFEPPFDI
jgi:hypothetical protein